VPDRAAQAVVVRTAAAHYNRRQIEREELVALARVVSFEGVSKEHMDKLAGEIREGEQPEDIPASEMILLHDAESEKSLAVIFFDNEDDYRRGDAALSAMPTDDTPGKRTSVTRYDVALRMTP
jgi:hypothetical protein